MEEKTTTSLVVETKPNLQLATKNINNWINVLSNDVRMHQYEHKLTLRDTFKGMSIHEMIKFHGVKRSEVMAIVDLQLVRFLKSINVTNTLTDFQQQELTMHLVGNYPHETLSDFVLMFKRVRHGYYGPIYNRIDITVISEYMSKYLEAKAYERENLERETKSALIEMDRPEKFESPEEYNEWKKSWYSEKLTLRDKLLAIEKKFNRMEKMGIPADKEKSYLNFRDQYIKKKTENDVSPGGTMGGNGGSGSGENVSIPDAGRSDVDESIQRPGSKHNEQDSGVQ